MITKSQVEVKFKKGYYPKLRGYNYARCKTRAMLTYSHKYGIPIEEARLVVPLELERLKKEFYGQYLNDCINRKL